MAEASFPPIQVPGEGDLYARLVTSMGPVVVRLEETRAPNTVKNFVGLATGTQAWTDAVTGKPGEGPLYSGVRFHRVIANFMAQCGDPLTRDPGSSNRWGTGSPGYRFADEFHPELRHDGPGILSMANSGPNSNGSQFFVTHKATPHLDKRHSVFGRVVAGQAVIEAMGAVPKNRSDRPNDDILLEKIEVFRSATTPTALEAAECIRGGISPSGTGPSVQQGASAPLLRARARARARARKLTPVIA
jgi:peptidyl-prolyl cis-trans isomerase A (cyclophilin A)